MKNVYLIGMPGCGKSTLGKIISEKTGMEFIDLDEYIVNATGESIAQMFEKGESFFRDAESRCLKAVSEMGGVVVATGGGIVERCKNGEIMKKSGQVIFIDTPPENIISNSSLEGRPLLAGDKNKIFDIYKRRYELYKAFCDVSIRNEGSADSAAKEITELIK